MRPDFILKNVMVYQTSDSALKNGMWQLQGKSFIAFPLQFHIRELRSGTAKADTCCQVWWISICTSRAR